MNAFALLLVPALASTPTSGQDVQLAEEVVAIPFDHSQRHVAVLVEINGKGPFLFQVDTYASIDACIDDDTAKELGLKTVRTVINSDGRKTQQRDVVRIDELKLGELTLVFHAG